MRQQKGEKLLCLNLLLQSKQNGILWVFILRSLKVTFAGVAVIPPACLVGSSSSSPSGVGVEAVAAS